MTEKDILTGVCECVGDVLDIPAETICADDKFIADLGADSLDLLDLTFRLEQRFGVPISPRDIERGTIQAIGGKPLEVEGVYTAEALAELRRSLPEIPRDELGDGLRVVELPSRFRVATMVNLVCRLLEAKDE